MIVRPGVQPGEVSQGALQAVPVELKSHHDVNMTSSCEMYTHSAVDIPSFSSLSELARCDINQTIHGDHRNEQPDTLTH